MKYQTTRVGDLDIHYDLADYTVPCRESPPDTLLLYHGYARIMLFWRPWVPLLAHLGPLVRWRRWDAYPILHLFAFSPRALRRLVERAGFDVLALRNSTLAAAAPDEATTRPGHAARRILRRLTAGIAGAAYTVSGGRWLVGGGAERWCGVGGGSGWERRGGGGFRRGDRGRSRGGP